MQTNAWNLHTTRNLIRTKFAAKGGSCYHPQIHTARRQVWQTKRLRWDALQVRPSLHQAETSYRVYWCIANIYMAKEFTSTLKPSSRQWSHEHTHNHPVTRLLLVQQVPRSCTCVEQITTTNRHSRERPGI